MKSKEKIDAEVKALKVKDTWGTAREIKQLPDILDENETIKAICSGKKRSKLTLNLVDILCVCTTKRIVIIDKRLIKCKTDDIMIRQITSITCEKKLFLSNILIHVATEKKAIKLKDVNTDAARAFVSEVQNLIQGVQTSNVLPAATNTENGIGVADEIMKFKQLLNEGIITQEEFEQKKKQLMN